MENFKREIKDDYIQFIRLREEKGNEISALEVEIKELKEKIAVIKSKVKLDDIESKLYAEGNYDEIARLKYDEIRKIKSKITELGVRKHFIEIKKEVSGNKNFDANEEMEVFNNELNILRFEDKIKNIQEEMQCIFEIDELQKEISKKQLFIEMNNQEIDKKRKEIEDKIDIQIKNRENELNELHKEVDIRIEDIENKLLEIYEVIEERIEVKGEVLNNLKEQIEENIASMEQYQLGIKKTIKDINEKEIEEEFEDLRKKTIERYLKQLQEKRKEFSKKYNELKEYYKLNEEEFEMLKSIKEDDTLKEIIKSKGGVIKSSNSENISKLAEKESDQLEKLYRLNLIDLNMLKDIKKGNIFNEVYRPKDRYRLPRKDYIKGACIINENELEMLKNLKSNLDLKNVTNLNLEDKKETAIKDTVIEEDTNEENIDKAEETEIDNTLETKKENFITRTIEKFKSKLKSIISKINDEDLYNEAENYTNDVDGEKTLKERLQENFGNNSPKPVDKSEAGKTKLESGKTYIMQHGKLVEKEDDELTR